MESEAVGGLPNNPAYTSCARVRILLPISDKTQNLMALGALLEAFFFVFCAPSAAILNNLLTHAKEAFYHLWVIGCGHGHDVRGLNSYDRRQASYFGRITQKPSLHSYPSATGKFSYSNRRYGRISSPCPQDGQDRS